MEEDIDNFSPTVMFRGTPCSLTLTLAISIFNSSNKVVYGHHGILKRSYESVNIGRGSSSYFNL